MSFGSTSPFPGKFYPSVSLGFIDGLLKWGCPSRQIRLASLIADLLSYCFVCLEERHFFVYHFLFYFGLYLFLCTRFAICVVYRFSSAVITLRFVFTIILAIICMVVFRTIAAHFPGFAVFDWVNICNNSSNTYRFWLKISNFVNTLYIFYSAGSANDLCDFDANSSVSPWLFCFCLPFSKISPSNQSRGIPRAIPNKFAYNAGINDL